MLDRCAPVKHITAMLEDLFARELLPRQRYEDLLRLVLARTGAVLDTDPLTAQPNHNPVLTHNALLLHSTPAAAQQKLDAILVKMQQVFLAT